MGPRVLITGGSGFLGINLIRYLLLKEMEVTNLDIVPFLYNDCRHLIRHVDGDIRDKAKVDKAMEDADMVVHCAAALPLYNKKDILSTDVDGTRNVIQSAYEHKVGRFVHISSKSLIPNKFKEFFKTCLKASTNANLKASCSESITLQA